MQLQLLWIYIYYLEIYNEQKLNVVEGKPAMFLPLPLY